MSTRPVIIGGGITGLAAAYEFVNAGVSPILVEPRPRLGGVIETARVEGCVLEGGPDSFLSAKPAAAQLLRELGLGDQIISSNDHARLTYVVKNGRLIPLPDGLMMMVPTKIAPVAFSPLLNWSTKIRMGLEFFRKPGNEAFADRSVAEFIADHYGREAVDYLAEPLLSGVYGGSVDKLSAASVLTRFVEMETKYGSLTKGTLAAKARAPKNSTPAPLFQTLKGGLQQMVDALLAKLSGRVEVVQAAAREARLEPEGWRVSLEGGETIESRAVVMACPAWNAGTLLRSADARLAELLQGIEYSSSLTLALGYNAAECGPIPPGFGFLVPSVERRKLVACTFIGAKFDFRIPPDKVVLRCFLGGAGNESVLNESDEALVETVQQELQQLLGWRRKPAFCRISRWPKSMAQYTVGHTRRIDEVTRRANALAGLYLAGNAYDGIGIPDCIRTGRAAAKQALGAPASARPA